MTVTYTSEVSTSKWLGCFLKLLLRWKGSIYKILWLDLVIYLSLYFTINFFYRFALSESDQRWFENVVRYCAKYANLIPLSFVLGFYVSLVMDRWWDQYKAIPYPDTLALLVGSLIKNSGEDARMVKRTIMRYVCLSFTMTLTMISPRVKKRFPELKSLISAGLLTHEEKKIMDDLDHEDYPSHAQYWLPIAWASNVTVKAKANGLISSNDSKKTILTELNKFRSDCGNLLDFDWISIPLVYTQVVTLAVYLYFLTTLLSRQTLLAHDENVIDFVIPVFTILEFFFYVGWLKVAESLINPFGEDDDDFEVVWLVDRNVQMSYIIVDKIHNNLPPLKKDKYWDQLAPSMLPTTKTAQKYMTSWPVPSTRNIVIKDTEMFEDNVPMKTLRRRHTQTSLHKPSKYFARFRKTDENSRLTTVVDIDEEPKHLNSHRASEPIIMVPQTEEENDPMFFFNELKEKRMKEKKEKLMKCFELMKRNKFTTEEERIIEEILLKK